MKSAPNILAYTFDKGKATKKDSICSNTSRNFGPQAKLEKLEINKKIKKLIHYDCNAFLDGEGIDDDIPNEDEVYIKENLLDKDKDQSNSK